MIFDSAYTLFFISINTLMLVTLRLSKVFLKNLSCSVIFAPVVLHCRVGFSLVAVRGLLLRGFSRGAETRGERASLVAVDRLSCPQHVVSTQTRDRTLSPILAGRFFTSVPLRKSQILNLCLFC